MTRSVWIRRAMAGVILVCALATVASLVSIVGDVLEVQAATRPSPSAPQPPPRPERPWNRPAPLIPVGSADPKVKLGEFLNARLRRMGLGIDSFEIVSTRPLGDGLRLIEARLEASGDITGAVALAEWTAVNRPAVRLKSLVLDASDQAGADRGSVEAVFLVVIS